MKQLHTLSIIFLILFILFLLIFPFYIIAKISLSPPLEIFKTHPSYFIKNVTWQHFTAVFQSGKAFWGPLSKSFFVALGTTLLSLGITIPSAYAISRLDMRLRYGFVLILFVSRMLPEVSIALPVSIHFIKMGLFDSSLGLILAHSIKVLPVSCFILVGIFSHFPEDLVRQAYVDGCSPWQAFVRIVLPLSSTGIVVAGLFSFLLSWDEFIYALYLTLTEPTMPLKMYYYVSRGNIFYSATYAIIIMIPVLIISMGMQRYMKKEYLSGALEG